MNRNITRYNKVLEVVSKEFIRAQDVVLPSSISEVNTLGINTDNKTPGIKKSKRKTPIVPDDTEESKIPVVPNSDLTNPIVSMSSTPLPLTDEEPISNKDL